MSGAGPGGHSAREQLLVKCWMAHDARWFNVVAREFGMETANRINQEAVREMAKIEWRRVGSALGIAPPKNAADCLAAQRTMIGLLGPDLLDYDAEAGGADSYSVRVRRCFAHENVEKAGIASQYDCGIFARIEGWLEGMGFDHQVEPPRKGCLKALGKECVHTIRVRAG